jgi:predicted RNase H-like nuclease
MIAGVDGCKDKWIAVVETGAGRTEIWKPLPFRDLCQDRRLELIVIDIPIGLKEEGPRQADVEARKFLGKRGSAVFPSPIRPILDCQTWESACRIRFEVEGKKISKQLFGILPKVCEVDSELRRGTHVKIREGHPEVSFAIMNSGEPVPFNKKKAGGKKQRCELVSVWFPDANNRMADFKYHREDVLDAYALLWTARRIQRGEERRFPPQLELDRFGLRMEIAA